jgi:hypothetical protein
MNKYLGHVVVVELRRMPERSVLVAHWIFAGVCMCVCVRAYVSPKAYRNVIHHAYALKFEKCKFVFASMYVSPSLCARV